MVVPCLLIFVLVFFERGIYGGIDWSPPRWRISAAPSTRSISRSSSTARRIAGSGDGDRPAHRLSRRLCHRSAPAERWQTVAALPRHPALLDQLPDPHLCLDRAAQSGRPDQQHPDRRAASSAQPLPLLYNEFAVVLGLVYNYTPFVILAIYSSLQRLDPSYAEASRDLGAGAVTTFLPHHPAPDRAGRGGGRRLCLRAVHREFRDARPARRRQVPDGRQPDLRPVPHGPRLALRRHAVGTADRPDDDRCSSCRPLAAGRARGDHARRA